MPRSLRATHVFRLSLALASLVVGSCASIEKTALPQPLSPPPITASRGLRAGFGMRDITPPPGVGMSSYASDSRQAVGFRQRLHARAIVLEDADGERVALVVADLGQVSLFLHRRVAERTLRSGTGVGADRLILSATHTHSGPGNFFAAEGLNANAGRFRGFDSAVAEFLIDGIAGAVEDAASDLRPARAGWRSEPVWDFTFNRSYEAYDRNSSPRVPVTPGSARLVEQQAVDSTFALLRVDRCDEEWERCEPFGAYGVFAIHGTAIPASNNLFDADIHGVVARAVERHIRKVRGSRGKGAFFLLAQGVAGDVSASLPDPVRCRMYRFLPESRPAGPRTLPSAEAWRALPSEVESCLNGARWEADSLAVELSGRVTGIFDRAALELSSSLGIARAFTTVDLRTYDGPYPICWPPRIGSAAIGGAEQGYIRTWRQRLLFFNLHFREGGSAVRDTPEGCFGYKRVQLGFMVKEYTLPQVLQLGVFRVGDVLIGTVPVEPTTEVGALIRETLLEQGPEAAARAIVVGLTNGYALYVATAEEYEAQHYEGGATIYGPNSAEMLAHELGKLSASLRTTTPIVLVDSVSAFHEETPSHFWPALPIPENFRRDLLNPVCDVDEFRVRWIDLRPGTLIPASDLIVRVEQEIAGQWQIVADDAAPAVQVRALEARGGAYLWEARWVPKLVPAGTYRARLLARQGLPEVVSTQCAVP